MGTVEYRREFYLLDQGLETSSIDETAIRKGKYESLIKATRKTKPAAFVRVCPDYSNSNLVRFHILLITTGSRTRKLQVDSIGVNKIILTVEYHRKDKTAHCPQQES